MTVKEAIEKLTWYSSTNGCGRCTDEEHKEAKRIAIEIMGKQIPKKVIFVDGGDSLLCPNCGLELMGSINEHDHDPYYCFECGQALDWEEGGTSD